MYKMRKEAEARKSGRIEFVKLFSHYIICGPDLNNKSAQLGLARIKGKRRKDFLCCHG